MNFNRVKELFRHVAGLRHLRLVERHAVGPWRNADELVLSGRVRDSGILEDLLLARWVLFRERKVQAFARDALCRALHRDPPAQDPPDCNREIERPEQVGSENTPTVPYLGTQRGLSR